MWALRRPLSLKNAFAGCLVSPNHHLAAVSFMMLPRWKSKKSEKDSSSSSDGTFRAAEMEVNILPDERLQRKPDESSVTFGKGFTDYMFSVRWNDEDGWGIPKIEPVGRFRIHPASKCLHYGVEIFEGMKAHRGYDENVRLFRPDMYMMRLLYGAKRLHLPTFDPNEFIECIKRLIKLEQDWIPRQEGSSLYIRPVFIGTEASLRITPPRSALLYVILCPVPKVSLKPISLYVEPRYVKSWPGSCGDVKMGGNYGPTIALQRIAEDNGCQQIMWVQGPESQITDISSMNIFFVIKNDSDAKELITPPTTSGMILNGVVRQSVLQLCSDWKKFAVVERSVTLAEFIDLHENHKISEIFGTGTYSIVTPVSSILYHGSKIDIPTIRQSPQIFSKIYKELTDIYFGKVDHEWSTRIDS